MSCARPELNRRLVELIGSEPERSDEELRAHAAGCDACKSELEKLREGWSALAPLEVAAPSAEVLARAKAAARGTERSVGVAGAAGLAVTAAILFAIGIVPAPGAMIFGSTALLVCAYALGLLAAAGRRGAEVPFYGVTAAGLALSIVSRPGPGLQPAICLAFATGVALVPLAITGVALARAGRVRVASGAFWGAAAGTLGAAIWRLHCPAPGLAHALLFHAMAVPIAAALGALAMRLLFLVRRASA